MRGLHFGPVHDGVAKPDEHVQDLAPGVLDQVREPARPAAAGKRYVDPVTQQERIQLCAVQLGRTLLDRLFQRLPSLVQRRSSLPPLIGRQRTHLAQREHYRRPPADQLDAHILQLRGGLGGRDPRQTVCEKRIDVH